MKPNRSKRNESRRMESWPGLIAKVKHRMQLSPTSVFMHYMPFCWGGAIRFGSCNNRDNCTGGTTHVFIESFVALFVIHCAILTVLELVLLDEILRRVVDTMVWFDGSDNPCRIAHHSYGRISRLGIKRGSDHIRRNKCYRHCILKIGGIVPVRTSSSDHKLASSSADDAIFWRSSFSYISPASVQCPMKKGEEKKEEETGSFNAFPKSFPHFYSDAFGSYTIRRQSEKQVNSSGTEIRDHDNDSTRCPSAPGDNETRETAHTPMIEPQ
ncbi:hypothetical protein ALC62_03760 [Cyphomyrmex costatus]|uniref:Uncharacterized protein n=1 Tax=Cyphomyrmex costatus TaxID=456900 RepID=A0A151IL17_9HYME|nr:hypothetical protein ALC62_03760 [Cyphomyrmex costatus]